MIQIDASSNLPKYKQIVSSIIEAVALNVLKRGQQIPSINQVCEKFSLSRETALTAYKELKSRGIISSSPGKGYFISSEYIKPHHKIFLLFDELNAFKEVLYNSLKESLGELGVVDIFFHHYNSQVFESLIKDNVGNYTSYVIMPIPNPLTDKFLKSIPREKLYILDVGKGMYDQNYASICQDFHHDVFNGLNDAINLIKKYQKLILIFPDILQNPKAIISGFNAFCKANSISSEVIASISSRKLKAGEAYFVIDDKDLVFIIKQAKALGLTLGSELGIISFNDTPLKEVVADGITTISTDFAVMGKTVVDMILNKNREQIHNPSALIKRASL